MGALVLGALALVLLIAGLRWFVGTDPKALVKGLRWFGAGLLALAAIGLAAIDRVGLAMLAGSMAWAVFTGGHVWPAGWPYIRRPRPGPTGSNNTKSTVKTEWVEMELDHGTGTMHGRVLKGDYAGRSLDDLRPDELATILRQVSATDPEGLRLLEAYMDRVYGVNWHCTGAFASSPRSGLTRDEALAVLGLSAGASEDDIRAAHRRLIQQIHPDHGGSSYLAAKINEARDVLLGD